MLAFPAGAQTHPGPTAFSPSTSSASAHGVYTGASPAGSLGYPGANHSLNHPRCCVTPKWNGHGSQNGHNPHHPYVVGEVYAVPYAVYPLDQSAEDVDDSGQPPDNAGDDAPGPTIFDRRGSSLPSSVAEAAYGERMDEAQETEVAAESGDPSADSAPDAAPNSDRPTTLLVFKDGHQLEVRNYAIVGATLFDLTPGRRTRIALADLDLTATGKENDDRGIDFQLPVPLTKN